MNVQKEEVMKTVKKRKNLFGSLAVAVGLIIIFFSLSEDLIYNELSAFDETAGEYIRSYSNAALTNTAIFFTGLGSFVTELTLGIIFSFIFYYITKEKRYPLFLFISLLTGWLLNKILKWAFQRKRPTIEQLVDFQGYSFPSAHAMVSTIFYGMIMYVLWQILKNRGKTAWPFVILTIFLVLAIGLSRVYLGVHYTSDVIAGYAAGGVWLLACISVLRSYDKLG
ncbi:phosphatase PAP2 family protein [Bacillus salacetis]|uniref:phosphatase PAP2 family protein n=1 Tax=Bacillus salacetis TaxID=2315464 RepID=UPI003BA297BC